MLLKDCFEVSVKTLRNVPWVPMIRKRVFCVTVLKFLICNVCDSFISNVFQVFLTACYSFLLFTRVSFLILKDFSLKERTVTIPCGSGDYDTVGSYDKKEGYFV